MSQTFYRCNKGEIMSKTIATENAPAAIGPYVQGVDLGNMIITSGQIPVNPKTGERILPAFYSDNYISVVPGDTKTITIEYSDKTGFTPNVDVYGWNTEDKLIR